MNKVCETLNKLSQNALGCAALVGQIRQLYDSAPWPEQGAEEILGASDRQEEAHPKTGSQRKGAQQLPPKSMPLASALADAQSKLLT